jgi:hypothetical protein
MISGAHVVIYSKNAGADGAFFRDVLEFQSVNAGHGWSSPCPWPKPPSIRRKSLPVEKNVRCSTVEEAPWGSVTKIPLPGGGKVSLYEGSIPLLRPEIGPCQMQMQVMTPPCGRRKCGARHSLLQFRGF